MQPYPNPSEYWGQTYDIWVRKARYVSRVAKTKLNTKKKTLRSSQGTTERVQKLRLEFWEQIKAIDPENLVFLDEMGVLLGLTRTQQGSPYGQRVYDLKPFYRGALINRYWSHKSRESLSCNDDEWLNGWKCF